MYRSRKVKCADCGDIIKIEYDSRKEMQDVYQCKCGRLKCYPDWLGGFSYDRNGNIEKLNDENEEVFSSNYDEDYLKLSDKAISLLSEIDDLGEIANKKPGVLFLNCTNEDYILLTLDGGSRKEGISIKVDVDLYDGRGWKFGKEETEERVMEALNRFKNILIKVSNGELDLRNPRKIWDDENLEWQDGTKTQQNLYDYELTC